MECHSLQARPAMNLAGRNRLVNEHLPKSAPTHPTKVLRSPRRRNVNVQVEIIESFMDVRLSYLWKDSLDLKVCVHPGNLARGFWRSHQRPGLNVVYVAEGCSLYCEVVEDPMCVN